MKFFSNPFRKRNQSNMPIRLINHPVPQQGELLVDLERLQAIGFSTNQLSKLEEAVNANGFLMFLNFFGMKFPVFTQGLVLLYQDKKLPNFAFEVFETRDANVGDALAAMRLRFSQRGNIDSATWEIIFPGDCTIGDSANRPVGKIDFCVGIFLKGNKGEQPSNFLVNEHLTLGVI